MISMNELKHKIALQYTYFIIKATQMISSNCVWYQILKNGSKTIHQYWLVDGAWWPTLQKPALWIFSMATSSAASEQAFSTLASFIQSWEIDWAITRSKTGVYQDKLFLHFRVGSWSKESRIIFCRWDQWLAIAIMIDEYTELNSWLWPFIP